MAINLKYEQKKSTISTRVDPVTDQKPSKKDLELSCRRYCSPSHRRAIQRTLKLLILIGLTNKHISYLFSLIDNCFEIFRKIRQTTLLWRLIRVYIVCMCLFGKSSTNSLRSYAYYIVFVLKFYGPVMSSAVSLLNHTFSWTGFVH